MRMRIELELELESYGHLIDSELRRPSAADLFLLCPVYKIMFQPV